MTWVAFFLIVLLTAAVYSASIEIKKYWMRKFIEFCEDRCDWTGKQIAEYLKYLNNENT